MTTDFALADDTWPAGVPVPWEGAAAAFGAVLGALGGSALGAFLGPAGILVGALLGAIGGGGIGDALGKIQEHRTLHDELVDEEIGVIDGNVGVASPDQPPALIGAYSAGSAGVARGPYDITPDSGPIPKVD